ncbi:FAD-dependent monooxygenase [Bradyrhizobium sp. DASA03076]|uniref:FAD-dependent monooxygenase n=1 Tax=Bradyrhizobium sp. BLXBL-03 TaxID=3395916 RepID=UPI003F6E5599
MPHRPRKALIIGAGIAGPVAAILLRRAGIESAVYEAWPYSKGIGGGLQIAPNGMHVMDEIGLAGELISRGSIAESFDFYSQDGRRLGSINRDMARRFGQPAVNVCRASLNEMLIDKAWCTCASLYFDKRLIKIEDRGDQPIIAYFADGTTAEGDFLIGADGVHSITRRQVVPDGPKPFNTGLIGFGGFVPHPALGGRAIGGRVETTFGQSGFFGYGYCSPDPKGGAMWWSTQPAHGMDAAMFRALDAQALKQHLRGFHQGWHDPIPGIIEAAENIVVTDTFDVATLPTWSRKRSLLIGDAAHATSPHAGQGASLALEDAMRLARLMQEGQELTATFQAFEAERRPRAEKIVAIARRNGNNKREFSAAGAWMRNHMIKLLLPLGSKGMDFMYAYDARAA